MTWVECKIQVAWVELWMIIFFSKGIFCFQSCSLCFPTTSRELKVLHKAVSPSDHSGRSLDTVCGINTLNTREKKSRAGFWRTQGNSVVIFYRVMKSQNLFTSVSVYFLYLHTVVNTMNFTFYEVKNLHSLKMMGNQQRRTEPKLQY